MGDPKSLKPGRIREEDIIETFVRSAGPGGQNVNKVATCVVLLHRPTGVRIRCERFRTQHQNRAEARSMLIRELECRERAARQAAVDRREKERRRHRKRPRALKERILEGKKVRSARKASRGRVRVSREEM
ncbi:MAG: peptide chain release factor-like protein [Elusimicrobia bacterium]|nr:peptide chain release factor-like protein [Elusimicrobiota bacterium]